jgi:peptidoglycan/LPS O-acetylase OafA/YrhL
MVLVTHVPASILAHLHRFAHHAAHLGGYLGVDLFFVLSGYLITRILLVDREHGTPLRAFYARRFLRIFPIYYLVLGLHAFVHLTPAVGWATVYLSNYYFAFTRAPSLLSHTWSLAVEEHFYLLWPLLLRVLKPSFLKPACAILVAASLAASCAIIWSGTPAAESLVYSGTQTRVLSLCVGGAVALHYPGDPERVSWRLRLCLFGLGGLGVLLGLTLAFARSPWAFVMNVVAFAVVSLALLLTALDAFVVGGSTARALTSWVLTRTGRVSYGLYLYHPFAYAYVLGHPTLGVVGRAAGLPLAIQLASAIAASFAVATLSFKLIEKPLLALGRTKRVPADPAVGEAS